MPTKIIGGKLGNVIVCSNDDSKKTLEWTNKNWKSPVKNRDWMVDGYPKECDCKALRGRGFKHFSFCCLSNGLGR